MRLYKVSLGGWHEWVRSKGDAPAVKERLVAYNRAQGFKVSKLDCRVEPVDFDTSKDGVLSLLNEHATGDGYSPRPGAEAVRG